MAAARNVDENIPIKITDLKPERRRFLEVSILGIEDDVLRVQFSGLWQ